MSLQINDAAPDFEADTTEGRLRYRPQCRHAAGSRSMGKRYCEVARHGPELSDHR